MTERLSSLLIPCLILVFSVYASLYVSHLPPTWFALLPWLPFILATVGGFLAWHFNKGRVLVLILLLLVPKLYGYSEQGGAVTAYLVVSCFCIALLGFVKERGFFNRFVVNRILFVGMLIGWCYAIDKQWISLTFLEQPVWGSAVHLSTLLLWSVLILSAVIIGLGWWLTGDTFRASGLVSIVSLTVISHFSISASQFDALISAQFLLWLWFLLVESHRMAYLDDLTKLPGRRALNEMLEGVSKKYAIAMVDVDHFKKFNDTYGHDMGDRVLKNVAEQLRLYSHPGRAFRYGGEEFTVLFRSAKRLSDVEATLEGLRSSIEHAIVTVYDPKKSSDVEVAVTASIGLAYADSGESPDRVLKRADEALYQSKKKGRNRVSVATSRV